MAEKIQFLDSEFALRGICNEAVRRQARKKLSKVTGMFIRCRAEHQDIVQIREAERQSTKYLVYESLKRLSCVAEANGIRKNSYSPNGVVTAVLGTSSGSTGI